MKIKICGMKFLDNIHKVSDCKPHYMGFIFYEKSPRYIAGLSKSVIHDIEKDIQKVGVFVNSPMSDILVNSQKFQLDYVQLHGNESLEYVKEANAIGIRIIKAFAIDGSFDWSQLTRYAPYVTYFLFDTACSSYGGSGQQFDWNQLQSYRLTTPFFLSGGIGLNDVEIIRQLELPQLYGIDANSKLELKPGLKDAKQVRKLINKVKYGTTISSKQ